MMPSHVEPTCAICPPP